MLDNPILEWFECIDALIAKGWTPEWFDGMICISKGDMHIPLNACYK